MTKTAFSLNAGFWWILLVTGALWAYAGFEKVISGKFPAGLAKTLQFFAQNDPYPWYKTFLLHFCVPNSVAIGYFVQFGELLSGLAIIGCVGAMLFLKNMHLPVIVLLVPLALITFFSALFWLAAAWTNVSTNSLNLYLFAVQLIAMIVLVRAFGFGEM